MSKDPVCGMMVDEKTAKYKSEYKGKTIEEYYRDAYAVSENEKINA